MIQIIGFTEVYYTLWDYTISKNYTTYNGGISYLTSIDHKYRYIKNISTDLDKVKKLFPNTVIDKELRGHSSWEKREQIELPYTVFPFGKLVGTDIARSNDAWQLNRVYEDDNHPRRKVVARKRLVELGELVPYKWNDKMAIHLSSFNDFRGISAFDHYQNKVQTFINKGYKVDSELSDNNSTYFLIPKSYITPDELSRIKGKEEKSKAEYLHKDGERVNISIKKVGIGGGYDTAFGYVFIDNYVSIEGNKYIYKGSNPPNIDTDDFVSIAATIKHNDYNGEKQTLLQRIKIK